MTKFTIKLKTPRVPNYIMTDRPDVKIHVSELLPEQVKEIADRRLEDLKNANKKPTPPIVTQRGE